MDKFEYNVALPAPSLYAQFNNLDDINIVLRALKSMGFDDVYEVAAAAEIVSEASRNYIKENIKSNNVENRGYIINLDVLKLDEHTLEATRQIRDLNLLISNPPYIEAKVIDSLEKQLSFEPRMALDGGDDGLIFYRSITNSGLSLIKSGGYLVFEIGYDQGESVKSLMVNAGYSDVTVRRDLTGNDRCVYGRLYK